MKIANLMGGLLFACAALRPVHAQPYSCVALAAPPISYVGGNGRGTGFAVEVVRSVFAALGKALEIEIYPLARALAMVKTGQADCVFSIVRSPERERFLVYSSEELVNHPMYLYARQSESSRYSADLHALAGLRVGAVRQSYNGRKFESLRSALVIDEAADFESNFKKLLFGRVNLAICSAHIAAPILALPGMYVGKERVARLEPVVEQVATYVAFGTSPRSQAMRVEFDAGLRKFAATPAYQILRLKYGIESPAVPPAAGH